AFYTLFVAPCFSRGSIDSLGPRYRRKEEKIRFPKAVLLAAWLVTATAPQIADARGGRGGDGGGHFGGFHGGGFRVGLGLAIGVPLLGASYYASPYYAPA